MYKALLMYIARDYKCKFITAKLYKDINKVNINRIKTCKLRFVIASVLLSLLTLHKYSYESTRFSVLAISVLNKMVT